jgi:hypothetical protein
MKRILTFFFATLIALQTFAAPRSAGGNLLPWLGSFTYAALVAAAPCSSTFDGYKAFVTDWGASGAEVRCKSAVSRWVPVGGRVMLKHFGAPQSSIANTATIVVQAQVPVGAVQAGDTITYDILSVGKSGTTDVLTAAFYAGTAGTTSDTAISAASNTILSAAQTSGSASVPFKVISSTSIQRVGTQAVSGVYGGGNATAIPSATTITDLSANALYFSFSIKSGGTTDTVSIQDAVLWQVVN